MRARRGTHRRATGNRFSARFRLTVTATLLATATFVGTNIALLTAYHYNMLDDKQQGVRYAAQAVTLFGNDAPANRINDPQISYQLLDSNNRVVDGDPSSKSKPPILLLAAGQSERDTTVVAPRFRPDHRTFVVALRAKNQKYVAVVAATLDDVDQKTARASFAAVGGGLLFLPIVSVLSWLLVGRTLRPVEQLRTQVAAITGGGDLSQRLPHSEGQDEVSRLACTLNDMLRALDEAAGTQRRFVADAAHELRTPLAGMTAFLEVAASHPDLIETPSLINRLLTANRHLSGLVNDLLTLAVLDAAAPLKHRPVDLAGVVLDGMRHVDPAGRALDDDIEGTAMVRGNPAQLTRVVTNLVSNAVRHANSAVEVRLRLTESYAVVVVIDDGPGIPPADRQRIFERFVRLDDDRDRASGGSGLGLALVKEIVVAHSGAVWVGDAVPGPGAVFAARIPLISPDPAPALGDRRQRVLVM
jgi:signal transduction histidine kinase